MSRYAWLLPLLIMFASAGCATIVNGTTQAVPIDSTPTGAEVQVGHLRGTTPVIFDLKRVHPHTVHLSKEGYTPVTVSLETALSGMVWGNLLFGGFIGAAIDSGSGSAWKLVPDHLSVTLEPLPSVPPVDPIAALAPEHTE